MTWLYEPVDEGTRVTVNCEYNVPIPFLRKMAESMIVKSNEKDAETFLANLKARLEGPSPAACGALSRGVRPSLKGSAPFGCRSWCLR